LLEKKLQLIELKLSQFQQLEMILAGTRNVVRCLLLSMFNGLTFVDDRAALARERKALLLQQMDVKRRELHVERREAAIKGRGEPNGELDVKPGPASEAGATAHSSSSLSASVVSSANAASLAAIGASASLASAANAGLFQLDVTPDSPAHASPSQASKKRKTSS
jgi:hypothetical protein